VAAGSKPVEEFRVYNVELAESRGQGLWLGHRCIKRESVDCGFAAGVSGAESVSIGALGAEPVSIYHTKSFGVDDAALLGRLGIESDRAIGKPADSKCEHSAVVSEREHATIKSKRQHTSVDAQRQPTVVITKRQPAQFIRSIRRERVQRGKRRQGVNASGELSWIRESRRGRRGQGWWWWPSLRYTK
jgi:hypothetical protein